MLVNFLDFPFAFRFLNFYSKSVRPRPNGALLYTANDRNLKLLKSGFFGFLRISFPIYQILIILASG